VAPSTVRLATRTPDNLAGLSAKGFETVRADYDDRESPRARLRWRAKRTDYQRSGGGERTQEAASECDSLPPRKQASSISSTVDDLTSSHGGASLPDDNLRRGGRRWLKVN